MLSLNRTTYVYRGVNNSSVHLLLSIVLFTRWGLSLWSCGNIPMLPVLKSSWMLFQLCICEAALLQIEMFFFSENWKMYAINQKDCIGFYKEKRKERCWCFTHGLLQLHPFLFCSCHFWQRWCSGSGFWTYFASAPLVLLAFSFFPTLLLSVYSLKSKANCLWASVEHFQVSEGAMMARSMCLWTPYCSLLMNMLSDSIAP